MLPRSRRITRFASSSFQLAIVYVAVVCLSMLGLYFYSAEIVSDINHMAEDEEFMYESYIFARLAPMVIMVMIAIAGLSFFISEFVIKRINTIQSTAAQIMRTGDLSRRIPIENEWDDLSKLALTLNEMLSQIERLLQDVRTVSDNIAHDMRTPLTRLHQHIELLNAPETQADRATLNEVSHMLLEEAETLLGTFQALLRISNIEHGKRRAELASVDLSVLVNDVVELYEPLASDKQIMMKAEVDKTPALQADRHLLFQALANLLDNAVKYTPEGGHILVSLRTQPNAVLLLLEDSGGGMAEADLQKAFQRFYRAESARHAAGSGLGLALAKAVIDLHHGRILLGNGEAGLQVRLELPIST